MYPNAASAAALSPIAITPAVTDEYAIPSGPPTAASAIAAPTDLSAGAATGYRPGPSTSRRTKLWYHPPDTNGGCGGNTFGIPFVTGGRRCRPCIGGTYLS